MINPARPESAIVKLKAYNGRYNTDHLKVHTMKIMMDGTVNGRTAAMIENYADAGTGGNTLIDVETLTKFVFDVGVYEIHNRLSKEFYIRGEPVG